MAKSRCKLKAVSIKLRTQSGSKKAKMGHHQNRSPGGWREKCSLGFGLVAFHVKSEMVRAGETTVANLALERLGSRVFSYVARELIGSCKAPLTALEMAFVWFFTCKRKKYMLSFSVIHFSSSEKEINSG